MARNSGFVKEHNVTGGVVTDFTGLNFPENTAVEADNVIFSEKSRVSRRFGFNYEFDYQLHEIDRQDKVVTSYLWQSVGGDGDISFTVVQIGNTLYFFRVTEASLSSGLHTQEIDLTSFLTPGSPSDSKECQFASGDGQLFVTHPYTDPFYVSYNSTTDTFTATTIILQIRDFEGVDDLLEDETRPTTLTKEHRYNLFNQGWYATAMAWTGKALILQNVLNYWDANRTDYPSNCDVWHYYKGPANNTNIQGEILWSAYFQRFALGNSPAPKGHYKLNVHYQDRSSVSGINNLPVVSTSYNRVSTVAFFAGRVWYSGIATPGFNQKLYFSQIIERKTQYGRCFQLNDPTSEITYDLLPTDGGVISITDAGTILKLFAFDNTLLVFATNGIWAITGSQGIGFTATDYSVVKISSLSILNTTSFVDVGGYPAWINTEGIYVIRPGETGPRLQSISDQKFKKYMDAIPTECKKYAKGAYNSYTRVLQWLYRSTEPSTISERYEYDRVININIVSNAFYPWSITPTPATINGLVVIEGNGVKSELEDVVDNNGVVVTNNSGEDVFTTVEVLTSVEPIFKYICSIVDDGTPYLTFASTNDTTFTDWAETDSPTTIDSFVTWGYLIPGDAIKKLQTTYVQVYTENENLSVYDLQSIWDYATDGNTGRWSSKQRCVSSSNDYSFVSKKRKLRGHGKTVQLKISSVDNQPFDLVGWTIWITTNQLP